MESTDEKHARKRKSLRDSVLRQPENRVPPSDRRSQNYTSENPPTIPKTDFFGGMRDFFGDRKNRDAFPNFGFGAFHDMERMEEHFSQMASAYTANAQ